jgi:pimeloyl-ACP methyl ester carboxylesterase
MFPPFAERLARAGFASISVNLSGSGADDSGAFAWPERFGHNTFSAELTDLTRVLDAVQGGHLGLRPPSTVALVGHSRGGGMGILLAARDARIRTLVTWAAISTVDRWPNQAQEWRARGRIDILNTRTREVLPLYTDVLDDVERHRSGALHILGAATRLAVPWLLIHGGADTSVPRSEAEHLAQATGSRARLLLIPDADHTFGTRHPYQGSTEQFEKAQDATLDWLGAALP